MNEDATQDHGLSAEVEKDEHLHIEADAMAHLLSAYRSLIAQEETHPLLEDVMQTIHALESVMTERVVSDDGMEPEEAADDAMSKVIREDDGQFCVISEETGRSFGCYISREQAEERLAQIESFANKNLSDADEETLQRWHDELHRQTSVTAAVATAHDLIEDELAVRSLRKGADPYAVFKRAEQRYTLGPVYIPDIEDAHGEFTDKETLQKALWDWVRKGDRSIFLQHSEKVAGEMVEMLTWPFAMEAELKVPNQGMTKYTFPADTPFMGVVWEDWAWELVKVGELRGYSIGGQAKRVEADLPKAALV
jgi:hypothetical protein